MRRRLYTAVAVFATVALTSCQRNSLRIEGDIKNLPDGPMTIAMLDSTFHWQPVDTTEVHNGRFVFDNAIALPQPECLILNVAKQNLVLFAGNDNVYMSGNALRPEDIKVSGSELNDALLDFAQNVPGKERLAQIQAQLSAMVPDVDRQEELSDEAREIEKTQLEYIRHKITENAGSPLGPFILFNNMSLFSYDDVESFQSLFRTSIPTHKYVHFLENELIARRAQNEALKRVEIGCKAPDFAIRVNGSDSLRLSSLNGKIILLDFWASWDEKSRKNNETIAAVKSKFSKVDLEIIGVSIDTCAADWDAAVKADKLPGHQLIDDGSIAALYGITTVPASFLIDKSGVIVSKDKVGNIFDDLGKEISK